MKDIELKTTMKDNKLRSLGSCKGSSLFERCCRYVVVFSVCVLASRSMCSVSAYSFLNPHSRSKITPLTRSPLPYSPSFSQQSSNKKNKHVVMSIEDGDDQKKKKNTFSIATLFGKSSSGSPSSSTAVRNKLSSSNLPPHPSQRPHISPLNILDPSKQRGNNLNGDVPVTTALLRGSQSSSDSNDGVSGVLPLHPNVKSGVLKNGLSYIILPNKSPPGRFEAHLQVFSDLISDNDMAYASTRTI